MFLSGETLRRKKEERTSTRGLRLGRRDIIHETVFMVKKMRRAIYWVWSIQNVDGLPADDRWSSREDLGVPFWEAAWGREIRGERLILILKNFFTEFELDLGSVGTTTFKGTKTFLSLEGNIE